MAAKFEVEATKSDMFSFLPQDIDIKAHLNGRSELPDIDWLIVSILQNGQLQNAIVRKDGSDRPCLACGFSRWRAISQINELVKDESKASKWLKDHEGIALPIEPMKLRCSFVKMNERDAFIANINENLARNATTELDNINNVKMLDKWEMDHKAIAAIYRKPESWVKKALKIASAEPEVLEACKEGRIKLNAVAAIAKLSSDLQREKVKGEGPIEVPKKESGKPSAKEFKLMLSEFSESIPDTDKRREKKVALLGKIEAYLSGKSGHDAVWEALLEI